MSQAAQRITGSHFLLQLRRGLPDGATESLGADHTQLANVLDLVRYGCTGADTVGPDVKAAELPGITLGQGYNGTLTAAIKYLFNLTQGCRKKSSGSPFLLPIYYIYKLTGYKCL